MPGFAMTEPRTDEPPIDQPSESRIYLTTPPLRDAATFAPRLEAALGKIAVACLLIDIDPGALGDAKAIARGLVPLAQKFGTAVLLRDPALAARVSADGVHLSAAAPNFAEALDAALNSLKPERIVGVGGLTSRDAAMFAGERDVDYVMFGDPSPGSPELSFEQTRDFSIWWSEIFTPPCVAFAADPAEAADLLAAGVDFVAFGPAIWGDPSAPAQAWIDVLAASDISASSAAR
jgi:thiamine-phosphate pyrophosphorylase